jgi:hypothetical protein
MKPFVPTVFYGVLNYFISLTLILSPWIFGLANVSSAAFLLPLYIGWLQLILAIFVDNETGFVKQFPMQMHLVIDVIMGFILMVSPWIYSFSSKPATSSWIHAFSLKAFWPALLLGGLLFLLGIFTKNSPFLTKAHRAAREGQLTSTDSFEGRLNV